MSFKSEIQLFDPSILLVDILLDTKVSKYPFTFRIEYRLPWTCVQDLQYQGSVRLPG